MTITEFLKEEIRIPSPPSIAVRILDAVKIDGKSFDGLANIISSDPALSAKILMVANSSFYKMPRKIDNISKALSILGTNTLKNIALSFVIAKELRGVSEGGFDFDFFWKRALTAAVSTSILSPYISAKNEDLFVTALLQDIGIVIMYLCRKDDYLKVLDEKRASSISIEEAEKKVFGFDHPELGAEVLKNWGIPETIYGPIRYHHRYEAVPENLQIASNILLLSDKMSSIYHGTRSAEKFQEIKRIICGDYGVDGDGLESTIDSVASKSVEMLSVFEIDPGNMKPFSQILQEANQELGKLNLSYEQLTVELKQAKEKAENYAQELKTANERLRDLAFKDGLTDLYNHRYFQDSLDHELSRAQRYKKPFSLIMVDLDHFKKINDQYGHPVGDIVLKEVSKAIKKTIRDCDIAARYGGEEFVAILPHTGIDTACLVAEKIRKKVMDRFHGSLDVTISIGAASWKDEMVNPANLINSADKALYSAKSRGKNLVVTKR